jgi:hypothetical protein
MLYIFKPCRLPNGQRADDVGLQSACEEATVCRKVHITLHSSQNQPFWLKSECTEPGTVQFLTKIVTQPKNFLIV